MALFETVRVEEGRLLRWQAHMERLVLSAAELGFPVPPAPDRLAAAVAELLAAAKLEDAAVRITVTQGIAGMRPGRPGCWIDAEPLATRTWRGVRSGEPSAIVSTMVYAPGPLARYKTANRLVYQVAHDEARVAGADEALLASAAGEVFEGSASNVFCAVDGDVRTPPVERGVLPGVMRAIVVRLATNAGATVREVPVTRDDLARASEVFLTNAIQGVVPLHTLDGRALESRRLGTRLREMSAAEAPRARPPSRLAATHGES